MLNSTLNSTRFWILAVPSFLGCAAEDPQPVDDVCGAESVAVVDMAAWQMVESPDDAFPDRPAGAPCTDHGWGLDDGNAFGVYTGECDYVTVVQPARVALTPCNTLEMEVVHDALTAPGTADAIAYIALALDDKVVWEATIPLPAPPLFKSVSVPIEGNFPAGTGITFHVHNHGSNGYRLLKLDRAPAVK